MNREDLLNKVKSSITGIDPEAHVILYGSRVREDASTFSDWDFLVLTVLDTNPALVKEIRDSMYEIELETEEVISCIIRNKAEWDSQLYMSLPFKTVVEEEGFVL